MYFYRFLPNLQDENDNDPVFVRPAPENGLGKPSGGATAPGKDAGPASPLQAIDPSTDSDRIPVVAVSMPTGGGPNDGSGKQVVIT